MGGPAEGSSARARLPEEVCKLSSQRGRALEICNSKKKQKKQRMRVRRRCDRPWRLETVGISRTATFAVILSQHPAACQQTSHGDLSSHSTAVPPAVCGNVGEWDDSECDTVDNGVCVVQQSRVRAQLTVVFDGDVILQNATLKCVETYEAYLRTSSTLCATGNVTLSHSLVHCASVDVWAGGWIVIDRLSEVSANGTSSYFRRGVGTRGVVRGGSYGGLGGANTDCGPDADFPLDYAYGDPFMPTEFGHAGMANGARGTNGGGKIHLNATTGILLDGTISSGGAFSPKVDRPAGSGGSILIRSPTLTFTSPLLPGRVTATGGGCDVPLTRKDGSGGRDKGKQLDCASGGGGRISFHVGTPLPPPPAVLASGGCGTSGDPNTLPCRCGGAGTIYSAYAHKLSIWNRPYVTPFFPVIIPGGGQEETAERTEQGPSPPAPSQFFPEQPTPLGLLNDPQLAVELDTAVAMPAVEPAVMNVSSLSLSAGLTGSEFRSQQQLTLYALDPNGVGVKLRQNSRLRVANLQLYASQVNVGDSATLEFGNATICAYGDMMLHGALEQRGQGQHNRLIVNASNVELAGAVVGSMFVFSQHLTILSGKTVRSSNQGKCDAYKTETTDWCEMLLGLEWPPDVTELQSGIHNVSFDVAFVANDTLDLQPLAQVTAPSVLLCATNNANIAGVLTASSAGCPQNEGIGKGTSVPKGPHHSPNKVCGGGGGGHVGKGGDGVDMMTGDLCYGTGGESYDKWGIWDHWVPTTSASGGGGDTDAAGRGGGIIWIRSQLLNVSGEISANGGDAEPNNPDGPNPPPYSPAPLTPPPPPPRSGDSGGGQKRYADDLVDRWFEFDRDDAHRRSSKEGGKKGKDVGLEGDGSDSGRGGDQPVAYRGLAEEGGPSSVPVTLPAAPCGEGHPQATAADAPTAAPAQQQQWQQHPPLPKPRRIRSTAKLAGHRTRDYPIPKYGRTLPESIAPAKRGCDKATEKKKTDKEKMAATVASAVASFTTVMDAIESSEEGEGERKVTVPSDTSSAVIAAALLVTWRHQEHNKEKNNSSRSSSSSGGAGGEGGKGALYQLSSMISAWMEGEEPGAPSSPSSPFLSRLAVLFDEQAPMIDVQRTDVPPFFLDQDGTISHSNRTLVTPPPDLSRPQDHNRTNTTNDNETTGAAQGTSLIELGATYTTTATHDNTSDITTKAVSNNDTQPLTLRPTTARGAPLVDGSAPSPWLTEVADLSQIGQGGGAGGSVVIQACHLVGSGQILAQGGRGGRCTGGGGGGGVTAFHWLTPCQNGTAHFEGKVGVDGGLPDTSAMCNQTSPGQIGEEGEKIPLRPCAPGFFGWACSPCPVGTYNEEGGLVCHKCNNKPTPEAYYTEAGWPLPDCPYQCPEGFADVSQNPKCLTPVEYFFTFFGGLPGMISILVAVVLLVVSSIAVKKLQRKRRLHMSIGQANAHPLMRVVFDDPFLTSFSSATPVDSENRQQRMSQPIMGLEDLPFHVQRIYLLGNNSYDSPWGMDPVPPPILEPHVLPDRYAAFADHVNRIGRWYWYQKVLLATLKVLYLPLSYHARQRGRRRRAKAMLGFVSTLEGHHPDKIFWKSIRARQLSFGLKFGSDAFATLGYIDILDFDRSLMDWTCKPSLPMVLPAAGDGSYTASFHLDLTDPLVYSLSQYLGRPTWHAVVSCFNRVVRLMEGGEKLERSIPLLARTLSAVTTQCLQQNNIRAHACVFVLQGISTKGRRLIGFEEAAFSAEGGAGGIDPLSPSDGPTQATTAGAAALGGRHLASPIIFDSFVGLQAGAGLSPQISASDGPPTPIGGALLPPHGVSRASFGRQPSSVTDAENATRATLHVSLDYMIAMVLTEAKETQAAGTVGRPPQPATSSDIVRVPLSVNPSVRAITSPIDPQRFDPAFVDYPSTYPPSFALEGAAPLPIGTSQSFIDQPSAGRNRAIHSHRRLWSRSHSFTNLDLLNLRQQPSGEDTTADSDPSVTHRSMTGPLPSLTVEAPARLRAGRADSFEAVKEELRGEGGEGVGRRKTLPPTRPGDQESHSPGPTTRSHPSSSPLLPRPPAADRPRAASTPKPLPASDRIGERKPGVGREVHSVTPTLLRRTERNKPQGGGAGGGGSGFWGGWFECFTNVVRFPGELILKNREASFNRILTLTVVVSVLLLNAMTAFIQLFQYFNLSPTLFAAVLFVPPLTEVMSLAFGIVWILFSVEAWGRTFVAFVYLSFFNTAIGMVYRLAVSQHFVIALYILTEYALAYTVKMVLCLASNMYIAHLELKDSLMDDEPQEEYVQHVLQEEEDRMATSESLWRHSGEEDNGAPSSRVLTPRGESFVFPTSEDVPAHPESFSSHPHPHYHSFLPPSSHRTKTPQRQRDRDRDRERERERERLPPIMSSQAQTYPYNNGIAAAAAAAAAAGNSTSTSLSGYPYGSRQTARQ
ncbi:unnamed protein product [Vitrella brassicaformis CCMP3155]|uniref:DUF8003 domain-containing protein n=5 Tax=Vitrella brassicaformis TaxID=1169539 RepID=A0A0G4H7Y3_VITBC|nr:unnamed protein product [Vitrella brassicaformis CCMP3155]|eukprot:CEM39792.1 unnamed protein product [Vitrella brassicaformis CCMP3155]